MNRTIQNECRKILLKLLCVNLNRLSEQTRAEVCRVARIEENNNIDENDEEMIEQPTNRTQVQINNSSNQNQICPLQTI